MADTNNITTGKMTNGEFTISYQKNGNGGCIPVIDGTPEPMFTFGYTSENDKEAGLRLIGEALKAANGNKYAAMNYMRNAITVAANEIKPDEVVKVNGNEILISYGVKKAYLGTEAIADLEDLGEVEMPNEAVKALLVSRTETEIERRRQVNIEIDLEYDDDEEDY